MSTVETADVVVVGTGPGGAIPAYHLAAGGAKVVMLERGPWVRTEEFTQDLQIGTYTRIVDLIQGQGVTVVAGNCVGGSSVVYFAAALRAPSYVFDREGSTGSRLWPKALTRRSLDRYYDRVEQTLPVAQQTWDDVPYAGGLFGALCSHSGWSANPVPLAVDLDTCTNCNWMLNGCRFGAKRSMLLNYLPAAQAYGAQIRPLHEVQTLSPARTPGYRYRIDYTHINEGDYRRTDGAGAIEAKVVVMAAGAMGTPVILQRSAPLLGGMPQAVGRYFSPNGDRVSMAVMDEERIGSVLGLERTPGTAYDAFFVGKPIGSMTYDRLDPRRPEFLRYGLQQIYFPSITNVLPSDARSGQPDWFGKDKRELSKSWRSWLTLLAMTEDDNEGVFGPPPASGGFTRIAPSLAVNDLTYTPSPDTLRGWAASDADFKAIVERDGLGRHVDWTGNANTLSAHPLASCRIGDDPIVSACDHRHELRGHPGVFVTDGAAVPTSLTVNPSLTIAALAERASTFVVASAKEAGVKVSAGAPAPGNARLPVVRR